MTYNVLMGTLNPTHSLTHSRSKLAGAGAYCGGLQHSLFLAAVMMIVEITTLRIVIKLRKKSTGQQQKQQQQLQQSIEKGTPANLKILPTPKN